MGRKKQNARDETTKLLGLRVDRGLWERFQALAAIQVPKVSDTYLLECAILEYVERHEPKTKKS